MRDRITWALCICLFGMMGATVRYVHDLGRDKGRFRLRKFFFVNFIGAFLSIICGLICEHYKIDKELMYACIGIVAIASSEIITCLPELITKISTFKIKI